jgi:hypothetical protein
MFGLVSLLVVLGLAMLIFKYFEAPVIEQGIKAQDQARQISGRGDDGRAAVDSFKTEGKRRGNDLVGLTVTDVTAGGALAAYGLQTGDEIIEINGTSVGAINDPETAKAMVVQNGFQGGNPVVVLRQGNKIVLPNKNATGAAAGATTQPGMPAAPPTANPPQNNSVKDQLKNLGIQTR